MGLFAWQINQMLSPKFWILVRRNGFMQTYIRQHRTTARSTHYAGGTYGPVKCVGKDEHGNRYYEDWDVHHRNQRRWVEYADYHLPLGITGDRVPPGWHGWMSFQYDDFPTATGEKRFYKPHYNIPHKELTSGTPLHFIPPGSPEHPNRLEFMEYQRNRKAQPWNQDSTNQFKGKKLLRDKQQNFEDLMLSKE